MQIPFNCLLLYPVLCIDRVIRLTKIFIQILNICLVPRLSTSLTHQNHTTYLIKLIRSNRESFIFEALSEHTLLVLKFSSFPFKHENVLFCI